MGLDLSEKQRNGWELLTNPKLTRYLLDGGARSGKTILVAEWMTASASQYPGSRQLGARKHLNAARASLWRDTLKPYLSEHIPSQAFKLYESDMIAEFWNGSIIEIGGLDDKERVEKILGREYLNAFLNEASQISFEVVQMVITRLAQKVIDPEDGREAIRNLVLDTNPRGPQHWLYSVGVKNVDPESKKPLKDRQRWARLHWTPYDNPHLPEGYIDALDALPELKRRRMLLGEWAGAEGTVYDEFDETIHVVDDIPASVLQESGWERLAGIDFGFTNPFVYLLGALDEDGRLYIVAEHYRRGMIISQHAEKIKALETDYGRPRRRVADHDAGDRAELESRGLATRPATKTIEPGVDAVKELLKVKGDGRPRLLICRRCENLINEFYDYSWEPAKEGRNAKEVPVKENDHAMDALRYMAMTLKVPTEVGRAKNPFN